MKSTLSFLLLYFFINNCLAINDFNITIIRRASEPQNEGCKNTLESPYYRFYLNIDITGLIDNETEWKLRLGDNKSYAKCIISGKNGTQNIPCDVNILFFPLKNITLPANYSHYDKGYNFTVMGWDKIANEEILKEPCYPNYLYSFIPSKQTQHEIVCDSKGNNQVTIYGSFENARLSADEEIEFSLALIVDDVLGQANCTYTSESTVKSSKDAIVCLINGTKYFQFFETNAYDNNAQNTKISIKDSQKLNLIFCFSSFLKLSGILLTSILLL